MLRQFKVANFKGFKDEFVLDLSDTKAYEFNADCVKDGIVNAAMIYGRNGVGKSNLSLAIFDIIGHLTDKQKHGEKYTHYANAYNESDSVDFFYDFRINGHSVIYEYRKTDHTILTYERFSIDGEELILFDRTDLNANFVVKLQGTESLNKVINDAQLSALKYIKSNTSLPANEINRTFAAFFEFVDSMLFFKSLDEKMYIGYELGARAIDQDIIEKNNHEDLQRFLNEAGIECKLTVVDRSGDKKGLAFDFGREQILYNEIASTGTHSLVLFYYWFQRIKENKVPFVLIDEFDAFYHYELAELVVKELKKTGAQFILTTHNVSLMTNDLLRPDCYFKMTKDGVKSLSSSTNRELREAHNIEKMYKAKAFDGE